MLHHKSVASQIISCVDESIIITLLISRVSTYLVNHLLSPCYQRIISVLSLTFGVLLQNISKSHQ